MPLPSVATVKKEIQSSNEPIIEGTIRSKELREFLIKRNSSLKVWLTEDATKNVNKIQHDETTDQVVGLVLPMDSNEMPISFSFSSESVKNAAIPVKLPEIRLCIHCDVALLEYERTIVLFVAVWNG